MAAASVIWRSSSGPWSIMFGMRRSGIRNRAVTQTSTLTRSWPLTLEKVSDKSRVFAPVSSLSKEAAPTRASRENEKHVSSTMARLSLRLEWTGEGCEQWSLECQVWRVRTSDHSYS